MVNVIKNFADLIEEEKDSCDCAVVIILSHGGNGKIYSVDELTLDVSSEGKKIHIFLFVFQRLMNKLSQYLMII